MSPETITRVHNKETKVKSDLPPSYHDFKKAVHIAEWARAREIYSDLDKTSGQNHADSLDSCRSFSYFARHEGSGQVKVISSACHLRWCPICTTARTAQISSDVTHWLKKIRHPKMLTLTLLHSNAPLDSQISALYKFFRTLRLRVPFQRECRGGIWFFQLKWIPESDTWHPHIHCLLDSNFIPKAWLVEQWLKITGNSYILDIEKVWNIENAAKHIARYCARPVLLKDLPYCRALEVVKTMKGRRMCGTWGTGKDCRLGKTEPVQKHDWKAIGSWSTVINMSPTSDEAKAIIFAWQTGAPLSKDIDLSYVDRFIADRIEAVAAIAESYHTPYLYDS